jgi:cytochrome c oxidase assembly factor CtaG
VSLLAGTFHPWRFVFDPEWALAIVVFATWYAWAAHVLGVPVWRRLCFAGGLATIALALLSPIEHVALDSMLSFHLLQNVMLADWAPPLLVLGITPAVAAVVQRRRWFRTAVTPAVALGYWLAVWYVVHIPAVYGYGLDHRWALGVEHLLFLSAGILFWWPVLVAGHLPGVAKLAYLGAAFFLAAPVAALIALDSGTLYPYYLSTPHLFGLNPHQDQQIGGILMAVEQSALLFVVFSRSFLRMLDDDERRVETLGSA